MQAYNPKESFSPGELVEDKETGEVGIILKIRAGCFALVQYVDSLEVRWYAYFQIKKA
jgi:hypothetical protein